MKNYCILICFIALLLSHCGGSSSGSSNGGLINDYDCNLSGLTVSEGVLSPNFSQDIVNYTVEVPMSTAFMTITPTVSDKSSSIMVDGVNVESSCASSPISLGFGENTITIRVTAEDGITFKIYTIIVTRLSSVSSNARLAGLTLSEGILSPAFSSSITDYAVEVPLSTDSLSITAVSSGVNSSIDLDGLPLNSGVPSDQISLPVGKKTIQIIVIAADGIAFKTYSVTVTRLSSDSTSANLSNITVSAGTLSPDFSLKTYDYSIEVPFPVSSITVTPTASGVNAAIRIDGVIVASGSASKPINIGSGQTIAYIEVTAANGISKKKYKLTISRREYPGDHPLVFDTGTIEGSINVGCDMDINNDGVVDLNIYNTTKGNITFYRGTDFSELWKISSPDGNPFSLSYGRHTVSPAFTSQTDVDGDGKPETLICTAGADLAGNKFNNKLYVYDTATHELKNSKGYSWTCPSGYTLSYGYEHIMTADLDNDKVDEIVLYGSYIVRKGSDSFDMGKVIVLK